MRTEDGINISLPAIPRYCGVSKPKRLTFQRTLGLRFADRNIQQLLHRYNINSLIMWNGNSLPRTRTNKQKILQMRPSVSVIRSAKYDVSSCTSAQVSVSGTVRFWISDCRLVSCSGYDVVPARLELSGGWGLNPQVHVYRRSFLS